MENQYNRFFESYKVFLLKTGFSEEKDLEGCSEVTINKLERKYDITIPLALRTYLSFFGNNFYTSRRDFRLDFRVKDIERANTIAKDIALLDVLVTNRNVRNDVDLDNILFVGHDSDRDIMYFFECSEPNPLIKSTIYDYKYIDEERVFANGLITYHSGDLSFIGSIMYLIYWMVNWKLRTERKEVTNSQRLREYDRLNLDAFEWIKYHQKHQQKPYHERMSTDIQVKARIDFCRIADVKAKETGIVMTIDEFEWAFIEHLRGLGVDI
jgi:hypothetical protein